MTTHQDNAARLARIAQIAAVVVVVLAVGTFVISMPAEPVQSRPIGGPGGGSAIDAGATKERFSVPTEDWTIALGPLNATREPISVATRDPDEIDKIDDDNDDERGPPSIVNRNRPLIRYLGSLGDTQGLAALIEFAGRQRLLRVGQEFDDEYEITEITPDQITVVDGFDEFTFEIEPAALAEAIPNPIIPSSNRTRGRDGVNPNAFPGGRSQPLRPGDQPPTKDDDEGSNT